MTAIAKTQQGGKVARPLRILVPLIQSEISAGNAAGLEHYRRAGEMLIEAKDQVSYGNWGTWLSKNFELSRRTAQSWMSLARQGQTRIGDARVAPRTLNEATGQSARNRRRRAIWKSFPDIDSRILESEDKEARLRDQLAKKLVTEGYRALAMELHPDRGGSNPAMARLQAVYEEIKRKLHF
jgi:hypothetical protein